MEYHMALTESQMNDIIRKVMKTLLDESSNRDEYYTLPNTIDSELGHYTNEFRGKTIYCNCDDYRKSNFVKYFLDNFHNLGLKRLYATGYNGQGNGNALISDGYQTKTFTLNGNGGYSNDECANFFAKSDIIVTNPPFSEFQKYVVMLLESGKRFLVLGDLRSLNHKKLYKYFVSGQLKIGVSLDGTKCEFEVPEDYNGKTVHYRGGRRLANMNTAIWYTNMNHGKKVDPLQLTKNWEDNQDEYSTFDGFEKDEIINVPRLKDIPKGYKGKMGVPITIYPKLNDDQFELVDDDNRDLRVNGKQLNRAIIQHRSDK